MLPFSAARAGDEVVGQWERTAAGSYSFVVPANVYEISGVVIGGGGAPRNNGAFEGGAGGGLHWRNNVPVTPGETLTVAVGVGGPFGSSAQGGTSTISRGATVLLQATGGLMTTNVGMSSFGALGGGGGNGGAGGPGGGGGNGGCGGGAGGYAGSGGAGESFAVPIAAGGTLPAAGVSSGAGRGGTTPGGANQTSSGWAFRTGESVGLHGLNGQYGSPIGTQCGGGGFSSDGTVGGVRIMYGGGRSYPNNARDI